jgi:hypothetical protein
MFRLFFRFAYFRGDGFLQLTLSSLVLQKGIENLKFNDKHRSKLCEVEEGYISNLIDNMKKYHIIYKPDLVRTLSDLSFELLISVGMYSYISRSLLVD